MSGFILSTDQSAMSLLFLNPSTRQEKLYYWSVYLTILHMIGRSKMNDRLPGMILNVHMIGRSKMNDRLPDMILNVHMIGRSKMNDRLPDMILNEMLLDVGLLPKKIILIR